MNHLWNIVRHLGFSVRDLWWLNFVVVLGVAWWIDRLWLESDLDMLETYLTQDYRDVDGKVPTEVAQALIRRGLP